LAVFDLDWRLSLSDLKNRSKNEFSGQADLEVMPASKWLREKSI